MTMAFRQGDLPGDGLSVDDPGGKAISIFQLRLMMGFLTEAVQRGLSEAGFPLLSITEHLFP